MDDVYTKLASAQNAYDAAMARKNELTADANKAKPAAQEAASLGAKLLAATVAGDTDVSDADILAADEAAKRVQAVADLAAAKAQHAHQRTLEPHVNLFAAQRDLVQYEFQVEDERLIDSAVAVDAALAALHEAIKIYATQGRAAQGARQRCHTHNANVRAALAGNELLDHHRQMGTLPVAVVPQHYGVVVPSAEMFLPPNLSRIDAQRRPIPSLAVMVKGRR
jgi:hypothetical protein